MPRQQDTHEGVTRGRDAGARSRQGLNKVADALLLGRSQGALEEELKATSAFAARDLDRLGQAQVFQQEVRQCPLLRGGKPAPAVALARPHAQHEAGGPPRSGADRGPQRVDPVGALPREALAVRAAEVAVRRGPGVDDDVVRLRRGDLRHGVLPLSVSGLAHRARGPTCRNHRAQVCA